MPPCPVGCSFHTIKSIRFLCPIPCVLYTLSSYYTMHLIGYMKENNKEGRAPRVMYAQWHPCLHQHLLPACSSSSRSSSRGSRVITSSSILYWADSPSSSHSTPFSHIERLSLTCLAQTGCPAGLPLCTLSPPCLPSPPAMQIAAAEGVMIDAEGAQQMKLVLIWSSQDPCCFVLALTQCKAKLALTQCKAKLALTHFGTYPMQGEIGNDVPCACVACLYCGVSLCNNELKISPHTRNLRPVPINASSEMQSQPA